MTEIAQMLACLQRIEALLSQFVEKTASPKFIEWADPRDFDPATLARLQTEPDDEPADPENAQIQGAEYGKP
jgi:hypothetical protein